MNCNCTVCDCRKNFLKKVYDEAEMKAHRMAKGSYPRSEVTAAQQAAQTAYQALQQAS